MPADDSLVGGRRPRSTDLWHAVSLRTVSRRYGIGRAATGASSACAEAVRRREARPHERLDGTDGGLEGELAFEHRHRDDFPLPGADHRVCDEAGRGAEGRRRSRGSRGRPILRPRPLSTYVDMRVHDGYQAARRVRHGDVGRPNTLRSSIFARSSRRLSDEDSDRPERLMYRLSIDMAD